MSGMELRSRGGKVSPHGNFSGEKLEKLPAEDGDVAMKRNVGLWAGVSFIVGTMIGSGIFISPKGVAEGAGSVGLSLILWVICGAISMCGALSFAELGTMIPLSGGDYSYLRFGYGGLIAFLFAWVSTFLLKPSSLAIITMTCAEYIMVEFFDDGCGLAPAVNRKLVAITLILLLMSVNVLSVELATKIQIFFTIAKIAALVVIIIGGFVMLFKGNTENLSSGFDGTSDQIGAIAIGLYNGMWAYDGWNNLNLVTEELDQPNKNLPRAIMIGIPLVTILYLLVNVSYFTVMSVPELLASPAVATTWAETVMPPLKILIPIAVAMSTFGAANGTLFTSGRLTYVAAREGHMLKILSMIHVRRLSPSPAIIFTSLIAILMVLPADIESLIDFFSFAIWFFYGLTLSVLVVLRFTKPDVARPYKVFIGFPIFGVIASIYLLVAPIVDEPRIEYLYATLFVVAGLILYFPFVYFKKEIPGMTKVNAYLQMLMLVSESEIEETELMNSDKMSLHSVSNVSTEMDEMGT